MPTNPKDPNTRFSALTDFVVRQQVPPVWQVLGGFVTLLLFLVMTVPRIDSTLLIFFLFILLSTFGGYMLSLLQRSRDMILTTEFQNALFASALDYSYTFCIIIKNDGNIVYMDRAFHKLFPSFIREGALSLGNFLRHGKVEREEEQKILTAIEHCVHDKVVCTIFGSDRQAHKLVVSIEPIPRPAGYIMLRSRQYIEQRAGAATADTAPQDNALLSKSNLAVLANFMGKLNTGFYVVDPAGKIMYANSVLENWLAYGEGEMAGGNIALRDLAHCDDSKAEAVVPDDFEGKVILRKKEGGLMHATVNQKAILGDDKKVLGCLALVESVTDGDTSQKKGLW